METEDISRLCESLSLSDEDGPIVNISGDVLLGKFLLSLEDKKKVLSRGPWHFDKSLIVLEDPKGPGDISKMKFDRVSFWVQFWNVPLMFMNPSVAKLPAEMVGIVIELPMVTNKCWGEFMRVRVSVDITKPLKRGIRVWCDDSIREIVEFLLWMWGDLSVLRECTTTHQELAGKSQPLKYGAWLRAEPTKQRQGSSSGKERGNGSRSKSDEIDNNNNWRANLARGTSLDDITGIISLVLSEKLCSGRRCLDLPIKSLYHLLGLAFGNLVSGGVFVGTFG
ncbi:hypothetical protein EZV62_024674 [Acer yangbiense]|uniref:Uncharacterized protein n=1 Tax=Acer yangbiense TaxID=1000413 RepID=A0A5C7GW89_9ROSI|nr:hypothetical protein EZV62_024674 [Acer yangbiense]